MRHWYPVRTLGAAAMLALAQPASAALLTATVSGTISVPGDSSDSFDIGVFGDGFQLLNGKAFSAIYSFDLDDAAYQASFAGTFSPASVLAGGAWPPAMSSSFGTVAFTIGERTVSFDGVSFGSLSAGTGERTFNVVDFSQPGVSFSVTTNLFDPALGFPASPATAGAWTGGFDHAADLSSAQPSRFYINFGDGRLAGGGLTPTSVAIAISAVPEIGSWAMMIVGFGAIGVAMRRTRRSPRVARSMARPASQGADRRLTA